MLALNTVIKGLPVFSVRYSAKIGLINSPVINPDNLHIDAFYCTLNGGKKELVLIDTVIRSFSHNGIIIDDTASLSELDDLVRLQPVANIEFEMIGKKVIASKKTIGKVTGYSFDPESLFIKKFYVKPKNLKSLRIETLTFDRSSIIEVTDAYIKVSGPEQRQEEAAKNIPLNYRASSVSASLISE
jgi:uncharacterized protein YrrD